MLRSLCRYEILSFFLITNNKVSINLSSRLGRHKENVKVLNVHLIEERTIKLYENCMQTVLLGTIEQG